MQQPEDEARKKSDRNNEIIGKNTSKSGTVEMEIVKENLDKKDSRRKKQNLNEHCRKRYVMELIMHRIP